MPPTVRGAPIVGAMSTVDGTRADQHANLASDVKETWMRYGQPGKQLYPQLLGFTVEDVRAGYCRMRLPFKPDLQQAGGRLHGGALASLLDAVLVPAIGSGLGPGALFSTVDLHVQYHAAGKDHDVVAEGWVTKQGRAVVFGEAEARDAETGQLLAKAALTYNIVAR